MISIASLVNNSGRRVCCSMDARSAREQTSYRVLGGVCALLFAGSTALTIVWSASMSATRGMPMPGGWTMSMAWMRMPGQTWFQSAASFIGMWIAMQAAMMLPSLPPVLRRYSRSVDWTCDTHLYRLTALLALGYFLVWSLIGFAVFPLGVAAAAIEMERPMLARAVPMAAGFVVLLAGAIQFTKWKAHHLTCCREAAGRDRTLPADARTAWRQGILFGIHCGLCCANLTAVLLVLGVMDLRVMAVVTAAITAERLAPASQHVARANGAVVIGVALFLIVQSAGLR